MPARSNSPCFPRAKTSRVVRASALLGSWAALASFGCGQPHVATQIGEPRAGIEEDDPSRLRRLECPLPPGPPEPARGEAVAFHRWAPAFWAGVVEEGGGTAYLEQYSYGCGPHKSRMLAEAEWSPETGDLSYTVRARHLVIRLKALVPPGRSGALGEVVAIQLPLGREQPSRQGTETLVMLGPRSSLFTRMGKMHACALRALEDDPPPTGSRGPSGEAEPVTPETVIGEWTGFALEEELLVLLRVGRRPEPARLALTRLEASRVVSEVFEVEGPDFRHPNVVLRSTSPSPVRLEAELQRSREGGSGRGRLTLDAPGAAERTLQVEFFFLRGESWSTTMLALHATATDTPCFRRNPTPRAPDR